MTEKQSAYCELTVGQDTVRMMIFGFVCYIKRGSKSYPRNISSKLVITILVSNNRD